LRPILISALALLALAIAWLAGGRYLTLFLDTIRIVSVRSSSLSQLEYYSGSVIIGDLHLGMRPGTPLPARFECDAAGRVHFVRDHQAFLLGSRIGPPDRLSADSYAFAPGPGDQAVLVTSHSMLAWPTPFDFNFMTGHSPSRRRNLYYRLSWRKPDGALLELRWRYEQGEYAVDGWSGAMIRDGFSGLYRLEIRPSPAENAAIDYIRRTKGWDRASYRVEPLGLAEDGSAESLRIVYLADEHSPHPGGGQSVELRYDSATRRIEREKGLQ
jgi:hypothetical protein